MSRIFEAAAMDIWESMQRDVGTALAAGLPRSEIVSFVSTALDMAAPSVPPELFAIVKKIALEQAEHMMREAEQPAILAYVRS